MPILLLGVERGDDGCSPGGLIAWIGNQIYNPCNDYNAPTTLLDALWQGHYPRIYDRNIPADRWLADYVSTYVQTVSHAGWRLMSCWKRRGNLT